MRHVPGFSSRSAAGNATESAPPDTATKIDSRGANRPCRAIVCATLSRNLFMARRKAPPPRDDAQAFALAAHLAPWHGSPLMVIRGLVLSLLLAGSALGAPPEDLP